MVPNADSSEGDVFAQVIAPLQREVRWRLRVACCEARQVAPLAAVVAVSLLAALVSFWWVVGETLMSMNSWRPYG
jgi:hypothetical protein